MAAGNTTTQSLADSIPTVIASARIVREQASVMTSSVDRVTLARNTGTVWNEVQLEALTAQAVTENTELDNPQQLQDTLFSVTPTVIGIQTLITDRVALRISRNAFARTGVLAQNAIERKKDVDGLTAIDGATTQLGAAGSALTTGVLRAARYRISSNATEPAPPTNQYIGVFHGFQIKDWEDEILTPISGAAQEMQLNLTSDLQVQAFRNGLRGNVGGIAIKEDGNLTIDSGDDAKGGVFHRQALVLVQGRSPYVKTREEPHIGGGATSMFHYDEYAYGERSAGNWLFELIGDAAAPTS